ncbi:MAG: STAS domain-containing protein [Kiritimatiellae bacterium]|jgi:anti-sigma B factor antagonist|nr:STAS domain-containing protein [Kiritimatiellia bacterium]
MSDKVLVTVDGDTAFLKIEGKGTYVVAPELKTFCFDQISRGICNIILDMNECGTMDSTFMGVMAGVAMRLRDLSEHSFLVINLTQKTKELLEVLGLTNLLDCYLVEEVSQELANEDDFDSVEELSIEKDKATTAKVMLKAHRDLVKANENNKSKFKNVINYLSAEVES